MLQRVLKAAERTSERVGGVTRRLRLSLVASIALHVLVIAILLIGLPSWIAKEDETPPETEVAMVFQGDAKASMQAPTPGPVPAPSKETAPPAPPTTGTVNVHIGFRATNPAPPPPPPPPMYAPPPAPPAPPAHIPTALPALPPPPPPETS